MSKQATRDTRPARTERALRHEISQEQIAAYNAQALDVATLKRSLKEAEAQLETIENAYIAMLDKGFTCEEGDLRMVLDVSERSVTPKYKELYAALAGPKAVEQAQESAGKKLYKHIKVVSGKVQA